MIANTPKHLSKVQLWKSAISSQPYVDYKECQFDVDKGRKGQEWDHHDFY